MCLMLLKEKEKQRERDQELRGWKEGRKRANEKKKGEKTEENGRKEKAQSFSDQLFLHLVKNKSVSLVCFSCLSFCSLWALSSFGFNSFHSLGLILISILLFSVHSFRDALHEFSMFKLIQTPQVWLTRPSCWGARLPFQPHSIPHPNLQIRIYSLPSGIPSSVTSSPFEILFPLPRGLYPQENSFLQQKQLPWLPSTQDILYVLSSFYSVYSNY